mmetsp:Transcript_22214/g.33919  ORF Transcript_22214/g.33919 Transcript_22214/m.33919 type:complete len:207 (+) Transcript_22214:102-722(+)
MKLLSVAAIIASASAFAPSTGGQRKSAVVLSSHGNTRSDFLKQVMGTAALSFVVMKPESAFAAKYGGFGAGSPEVLDPSEAIVDKDILQKDSVQKALGSVKGYYEAANEMLSILEKNGQADIGPIIRKDFEFSKLRTDLNTFNEALDEDTQRGTDRLIRIIMQDITELETANKQKDGIPRSDRRLDIMKGKLSKLSKAFKDYLAFV